MCICDCVHNFPLWTPIECPQNPSSHSHTVSTDGYKQTLTQFLVLRNHLITLLYAAKLIHTTTLFGRFLESGRAPEARRLHRSEGRPTWRRQHGACLAIVSVVVTVPLAVIVFSVFVKIPVTIMIPMMVVFNSTVLPGPVARKVSLAIIVRVNPIGSHIGGPSPVAIMPFVMAFHRIPVAFHPYEIRPRLWGLNIHNTGWRWRSDLDSDRNLRPNR